MNWDALGAIGEIVGAIAVLLTLLYLALQVRQANATVRSATTSDHHNLMATFRLKLAENPELTDLLHRGLSNRTGMSEQDTHRFDQLMSVLMHASEQAYEFEKMGVVDGHVWDDQKEALRWLADKPGFVEYWNQWKKHREHGFGKEIQSLIEGKDDA